MAGDDAEVREADVAEFLDVRPRLFGIAYRMLGSVAEAEDIVQDAWIRWQGANRREVRNPAAFLTTTTTRLALTAATSARARRETYVGQWLPEPVDTSDDPSLGAERAEALDLAVLVLLEKLSPAERAVYVLHEAFDYSYRRIGEILEITEVNARQLARRARQALESGRAAEVSPEVRRELVETFAAAARNGDLEQLERLFTHDAVARADGGGKVHASKVDLRGSERVILFIDNIVRKYWREATFSVVDVNGGAGVLVADGAGAPMAILALDATERGVERVYFIVNPDKLRQYAPPVRLGAPRRPPLPDP